MSDIPAVLPRYSPEAEPFWEGLRNGKVRIQRCNECDSYQFYPRPICVKCWSKDIVWDTIDATGVVYSYTVPSFAPHPSFKARLPYIVALVDLDVGVRMMTNIVDCDPDEVTIGMSVEPAITSIEAGHALLYFKPKKEK